MDDVTEFLYRHKMIHFHRLWLAHAVHVVSGEINKHDMFCAILFGCLELFGKFFIL
jgi:hypothetical protein